MADEEVEPAERKRRKCHLLANELGLTRDERHDFAEWILHRDVTSWQPLEEHDYERLLDALTGFEAIVHLLSSRAQTA